MAQRLNRSTKPKLISSRPLLHLKALRRWKLMSSNNTIQKKSVRPREEVEIETKRPQFGEPRDTLRARAAYPVRLFSAQPVQEGATLRKEGLHGTVDSFREGGQPCATYACCEAPPSCATISLLRRRRYAYIESGERGPLTPWRDDKNCSGKQRCPTRGLEARERMAQSTTSQ